MAPNRTSVRLHVGVEPRDPERFPPDDDALGERLASLVMHALGRGVPPPALFVIRTHRVEILDLRPVLQANHPLDLFIAAAAGQEHVEAVALLAVLDLKDPERSVGRAGAVFIEWPDNRWWHAYHLLNQANAPLDDMPRVVRRAVDGLPRPAGLGGWFSRSRYFGLRLTVEPPEVTPGPSPLVH
ncbi:MAG: hypothetical protein JXB39_13415 [Deltaproteobacteria bacterium]|nr:hypothetical protein [Deltaproteobacteria bacterium]